MYPPPQTSENTQGSMDSGGGSGVHSSPCSCDVSLASSRQMRAWTLTWSPWRMLASINSIERPGRSERHPGHQLVAGQAAFRFGQHKPGGDRQVLLARLPGALGMQGGQESGFPATHVVSLRTGGAVVAEVLIEGGRHAQEYSVGKRIH